MDAKTRLLGVVIIQILLLCSSTLPGGTDALKSAHQQDNRFGVLGTRWLEFPDGICAGDLYFQPATKDESAWFHGQSRAHLGKAQGVIPVPARGKIRLTCTYDLTVHPENLRYMPPDVLAIVDGAALPITDDICEPLSKLTWITELDLKRTDITDKGLAILYRLPRLKTLLLDETDMSGEFLASFKGAHILTHLSISNNTLSMEGVKNLAHLEHLQVLELCQARVTDDMLVQIAQMPASKDCAWRAIQKSTMMVSDICALCPNCNCSICKRRALHQQDS